MLAADGATLRVFNSNMEQTTFSTVGGLITSMERAGTSLFVASFEPCGVYKVNVGIIREFDISKGITEPVAVLCMPGTTYSHKLQITRLRLGTVAGQAVLASACASGAVKLWTKAAAGSPGAAATAAGAGAGWACQTLEGHARAVRDLAWAEQNLFTVADDGLILGWTPASQLTPVVALSQEQHGHGEKVAACVCVAGHLITGGQNGSLRAWGLSSLGPGAKPVLAFDAAAGKHLPELQTLGIVAPPTAGGAVFLAAGYANGQLLLKSLQNFEDVAGVGRGRNGSGGHFKPILDIKMLQMVGDGGAALVNTDTILTCGMDGLFIAWVYDPNLL
ncbi:unnamed protein product [Symbiodinium sp. KB8]|nr:unnamed protein product [Symbiodinium sp. KB8]